VRFSVYVCAPFAMGAELRRRLPGRLAAIGAELVSSWLDAATGAPEDFSRFTPAELRDFAEANDADLRSADVALLIDPEKRGRETYSEVRLAIEWGKPVVWVGPPTLSAWRRGVVRVADLDAAILTLSRMQQAFADGARGELLACLVGAAA
jgi:hypothetical protein